MGCSGTQWEAVGCSRCSGLQWVAVHCSGAQQYAVGCSGVQWHRHTMFDDMVGCTGGSTQCTGGDRLGGMVVLRSDTVSGRCWKQHGNTGTG